MSVFKSVSTLKTRYITQLFKIVFTKCNKLLLVFPSLPANSKNNILFKSTEVKTTMACSQSSTQNPNVWNEYEHCSMDTTSLQVHSVGV